MWIPCLKKCWENAILSRFYTFCAKAKERHTKEVIMLFNSWQYVVFLPMVFLGYWALPHKLRWVLLLAASYYFYMSWNANLIVLISTTTLVSFLAALKIEKAQSNTTKKIWLFISCFVSLGLLFFFKYFNFFSQSVVDVLQRFSLPVDDFTVNVLLPVGISFYTFQTLAYVIDVYKGEMAAEKHLGIFALFVSFFPQLVAGPIERAPHLLPQFHRPHTLSSSDCSWGLRMIVFGLVKKMFIADYFAQFANTVFNDAHSHTPMSILVGSMFFAIQIYCDFSGYSDVARGSAKLLGFDLMLNFNTPYFSKSIREFWSRWHISLSTFFRDYVYIPLGGNRKGTARKALNIFITFLVSGLWHGAAWTFVLWGAFHGVAQIVEDVTEKPRKALKTRFPMNKALPIFSVLQTVFVFLLVCASWILFRANSLSDALYMLMQLPKVVVHPVANLQNTLTILEIGMAEIVRIGSGLAILFLYDRIQYHKKDPFILLSQKNAFLRISVSYGLAFLCMLVFLTATSGAVAEFIYFQF